MKEKMKAAVYSQYGPPEVVRLTEIDRPQPKNNEILIKVHATTVNRTDCGFRSAEYFVSRFFSGLLRPKQPVLGSDFAGEVVGKGDSVTAFQIGDRVFGYDDSTFGGHAEYMTIAADKAVALIPEGMSYEAAAPVLEGLHYAWCDIRATGIKAGQPALVYGATGAIGSAAVQLLVHLGSDVTAVCHGRDKAAIEALGPRRVLDYTTEDYTQIGETFDLIFDAVGKSSFSAAKKVLSPKGIYMSTELGKRGENIPLALITPLLGGKRVLFPIPSINQEDLVFYKDLVASGAFKPLVDRTYPFDQLLEAYRYVESGQKVGNVVIRMG